MKKYQLYILLISLFSILSCSKESGFPTLIDPVNEPPLIKVNSPVSLPELHPSDVLKVNALITDKDLVAIASWEALEANSSLCGSNPFKASFSPRQYDFEMNISFIIPDSFKGFYTMRIHAMDSNGNISSSDIKYYVSE